MKRKFTWKKFFLAIGIICLLIIIKPVGFLTITWLKDGKAIKQQQQGFANDASHLNNIKIESSIVPSKGRAKAEAEIITLIKQARKEGKKISIAGTQHSMGGHTIFRDGILLDMHNFNSLHYDANANTLHVGAGARWSEVIPYLNKFGKSVSVMQSNNSFSVGGSVSVNCHGWTPNTQSIAASVKSFRLVDANGKILTCSRQRNAELFSLVLGGYGLFGVLLDVELEVTDNVLYTAKQYVLPSQEYVKQFKSVVTGSKDIGMTYGRINVSKKHFMEDAILATYLIKGKATIGPIKENGLKTLRRTVFRGSAGSNYGKQLRWDAERMMADLIEGKEFSRNQLMNEGIEVLQNHDGRSTDILHEYFIPIDSVNKFINTMQLLVPKFDVDLLNITLRDVKADETTKLRYAKRDVMGFVLLFNQMKTPGAERAMEQCTQQLIEEALKLDGTYYLPYRLHATKAQFYKAYPQAKGFFMLKDKYDPDHIFQNQFYVKYK